MDALDPSKSERKEQGLVSSFVVVSICTATRACILNSAGTHKLIGLTRGRVFNGAENHLIGRLALMVGFHAYLGKSVAFKHLNVSFGCYGHRYVCSGKSMKTLSRFCSMEPTPVLWDCQRRSISSQPDAGVSGFQGHGETLCRFLEDIRGGCYVKAKFIAREGALRTGIFSYQQQFRKHDFVVCCRKTKRLNQFLLPTIYYTSYSLLRYGSRKGVMLSMLKLTLMGFSSFMSKVRHIVV